MLTLRDCLHEPEEQKCFPVQECFSYICTYPTAAISFTFIPSEFSSQSKLRKLTSELG